MSKHTISLKAERLAAPKLLALLSADGEICALPHLTNSAHIVTARDIGLSLKTLSIALEQDTSGASAAMMLEILGPALRAFPHDVKLWHAAGKLAVRYGHHDMAAKFFDRGLRYAPDDSYLLMSSAKAHLHSGMLGIARERITRIGDIHGDHPATLVTAAQIELETFRANGNQQALSGARQLITRLADIGDDHPAALTTAAQIELEAFRANGDQQALNLARQLITRGLDVRDDHPAMLVTAVQIELETFQANGDQQALSRARQFTARLLDIDRDHSATLVTAAQIELEAFRANGDQQALSHARQFITRRLDVGDDHPAALVTAAQIELETFRGDVDKQALGRAQQFITRLCDVGDDHPAALVTAVQIELETFRANVDKQALSRARQFTARLLDIDRDHPATLVAAAQIELEAFRANGDQQARSHARQLITRRLDAGDDHPAALVTAAQIELDLDDPKGALHIIGRIPAEGHKGSKIAIYIEAKANMRAGHVGRAIALIRPLIEKHPDPAFATLYLACFEDGDGHVGTLKTLLGPAFDRMWENSRDIRNKVHEVNEHERALFYGNSIWELGAEPVNKTALRQMAALPLPIRRALDNTP